MVFDWTVLRDFGGIGLLIGYLIYNEKRNIKRNDELVKQIVASNIPNDKFEDLLIENLKKYEEKNIKEHAEIKEYLQNNHIKFDEIQKEIADIYNVIKFGDDKNTKHDKYRAVIREKIADALPYFSNERLRYYIVENCQLFSDWIIESSKYIFVDDKNFDLCREQLRTQCLYLKDRCLELLSEDVCNKYYDKRTEEINKFFDKVKNIKDDRVNDRVNKFINTSILFMQDNISLLLNLWVENYEKDSWKKDEKMDGLEELRKIEKEKIK